MTKIRLGDIGKVLMCKRVLKHQTSDTGEIPFFKISTFGGVPDTFISEELYEDFKTNYNHPKKGDVLISAAGTLGKTVIYDGKPSYFQDSNIVWIDNDESQILNKYLYYFYQTKPWQTTTGSTIKRIYNNDLRALKIEKLPLSTQHAITSVLSALDDKIELNNRINEVLEAKAKLLYDYWFVQFEFPASGASAPLSPLDGSRSPRNGGYKSSGGKMVYNKKLKREIPEGWEVKRLEEIESNIITGKTPSTKIEANFGGDIPFITIDDLRQNLFTFTSERTLTEQGANTQKTKYLSSGDLSISCIGTIGVIGIIGKESQTNQQINTISEIQSFNRYFLLFALRDFFENSMIVKSGAVLKNMNKGEFGSIKILNPPNKIKEHYTSLVHASFEKIKSNIQENQHLVSLRDWLLPMLMNGQVGVERAYEIVDGELGMVAEPGDGKGKENENG